MPLEKLDKTGFVYIAYRREHMKDFEQFKFALEETLKQDKTIRDIIIDLTKDKMLTEGEVALIAKVIQKLQGTSRRLRIIANPEIAAKLESTNLLKIKNIFAYTHHELLLADLNKNNSVLSG
jgi:anti-anti-sigma regulatory factor